jgi:hypothetical protein
MASGVEVLGQLRHGARVRWRRSPSCSPAACFGSSVTLRWLTSLFTQIQLPLAVWPAGL